MKNTLVESTGALSGIDPSKPLVKEFFDRDAAILDYLKTRIPHVPKAASSIKQVYVSKDKTVNRFRINWYAETEEGFMTVRKIVASRYFEVVTSREGVVKSLTDLTR